jgi:hypothetical protein
MTAPNLIILYVKYPVQSGKFYQKLLGRKPEGFPTYQCIELGGGILLGLWSTQAKDFVSSGKGHRSEIAFQVINEAEVVELYESWKALGVEIEQDMHMAAFGKTFVALDPDGHRIRVNIPDQ